MEITEQTLKKKLDEICEKRNIDHNLIVNGKIYIDINCQEFSFDSLESANDFLNHYKIY